MLATRQKREMNDMIDLPTQLQKPEFRFVLLRRKQKIPFEASWQTTNNYDNKDQKFLKWRDEGNNYGIIGGYGKLLIIDFDSPDFERKFLPLLPPTFMTQTGNGGKHLYYICDDPQSFKILDEQKNTLADIQGRGKQVVGPGSIHPTGNPYIVLEDRPINNITIKQLKILFAEYLKPKDQYQLQSRDKDTETIKQRVSLTSVMSSYHYDLSRNPTMCQLGHDSKGGSCFSYTDSEGLWCCFHCDEGGDIFSLVQEHEGCDFITSKKILAKKAGVKLTPTLQVNNPNVATLTNYAENTEKFHSIQPFFYDENQIFWLWDANAYTWRIVDDIDMMNLLDSTLLLQGQTISKGIKNNYIEAFKRIGRLKIPEKAPKSWVQFKDIIFDFDSGLRFKATPEYLCCNPIPWEVGSSDETPVMDKLFTEWVGETMKPTLYEIIAYCCLADYPIHLFFCLVGAGRNGKSKYQQLIKRFVGVSNICSTELDLLIENRFESAKLFKKLVCLLGETNFGVMKKTSLLKKLTGGDLIGYEFKQKKPFDDVNYAKILINSNSLPSTTDTSEGFYRRWFIIDFPNQFPEGKDILKTIPKQEYRNLACKIIKILPQLLGNGKFTHQGTIADRKRKYIMSSNPLPLFIDVCCYRSGSIKKDDLYNAYAKFLHRAKKRVVGKQEFTRGLIEEDISAGVQERRTNEETGFAELAWWIDDVHLKPDWEKLIANEEENEQ